MLYSRHLWILGIAILCLLGLTLWKTPQAVWNTLTDPQFASSPRVSVLRYWDMLDSRQTDLARELLTVDQAGAVPVEFQTWEKNLKEDPFLTIKQVEFLDSGNSQNIIVRVSWNSLASATEVATYSFQVVETEQGWRIYQIRRI